MRIGELSRRAGVSPRALRHYEELGLLPARRGTNGYREYDEHHLRLVAEIRALVGLGFALEETRPFLECLQAGRPTGVSCPDSLAVHRRKLSEVDAWLAQLQAVRHELAAQLRTATEGRAGPARCDVDHPTEEH